MYLNNLGNSIAQPIREDRIDGRPDRAIVINEQAVESTPVDHPNRAGRLNNLGNALQSRFERTGSMDDLDRAITTNRASRRIDPSRSSRSCDVSQQFGDCTAEPIREDRIDG